MKILITGASGFIGQHLSTTMINSGFDIRVTSRRKLSFQPSTEIILIENMDSKTDWSEALSTIDIVIHLAACAHKTGINDAVNSEKFNRVNVEATKNLALQAVKHKVKRFIYLSSVKVYGDILPDKLILTETTKVGQNCDAYGLSKLKAEQQLIAAAENTAMEYVIIRSPLVYGEGVAANFNSLLKLSDTPMPLPFLNINNKRSMVNIDNLIDFIQCCTVKKAASNQLFLISDMDDIALPRLIRLIRQSLGRADGLFPFPQFILYFIAFILGKSKELGKLTSSIRLSANKAQEQLGWQPIISVENALIKTTKEYLKSKQCS